MSSTSKLQMRFSYQLHIPHTLTRCLYLCMKCAWLMQFIKNVKISCPSYMASSLVNRCIGPTRMQHSVRVVLLQLYHYDDLCLLVRFKGCEYHCYTSHITPHNPKNTKLDRREYMTTVGPQNAHRAKCNDNSHRTGTLLDPDILYNQTASSEADNHFTTSVSTHDQPEVCQPPHIKGRAYGRKQRLNRIRRRVYRRELHQKKKMEAKHIIPCGSQQY